MSSGGTVFVRIDLPRRRKGKHPNPPTGKQIGKRVSQKTDAAEPPNMFESPPLITISGGGYGNPPHQHVDPSVWASLGSYEGAFRTEPFSLGHQRRRKYIGRRAGRQTGAERQKYFADLTFYLNGFFPPWDPLGRSPTGIHNNVPQLQPWQRVWP